MLRANPWQWVALEEPVERLDIQNPANYRVTFNTDASLAITADCNNAAGFYQGEGGNLSVEIGPVAMAGCSTESLSNKFIDLLARAVSYPGVFPTQPITTTEQLCPELAANQEASDLTRLGRAVAWWYDAGYLVITYVSDDNGVATFLVFLLD